MLFDNFPDGFKETEIGPLPVDWEVVPLGSLARVKYGKAKPKQEGTIPAVGSGGTYAWVNETLVDFPTLVIGRKGTAGRAWLMDKPCWPSDTTFYLEWTQEVDIHFLFGYLTLNPLSGEHAKTTLPSLSRPDLESYLVPLPPLPEQRRIAHVLSTIQRAIAAQDDLIAAAREVKRSLMQRLFTYGPGPEPAPTKETEIGEIPEHWEVKQLQEAAKIVYGVQAAVASNLDPSIGIPILTNVNISADGMLNFTKMRYYSLPDKKREKLILQRGDILFNWRSGSVYHVGKTAFFDLPGEYTFSSFLLRIRADPEINNHFLFYYLTWLRAVGYFVRRCLFLVNAKFNASEAARTPTTIPPLEEQNEIAQALTSADRKIATGEQRKAALQVLFKAMLQQLMTGQIRVPLDTGGSDYAFG